MDYESSDSSWTTIDFPDADDAHATPTPPPSPLAAEPHEQPPITVHVDVENKESIITATTGPRVGDRWVPIDELCLPGGSTGTVSSASGQHVEDACASTTSQPPSSTDRPGATRMSDDRPPAKRVDSTTTQSFCSRLAAPHRHHESCECRSCQRAHKSCFTVHGCVIL